MQILKVSYSTIIGNQLIFNNIYYPHISFHVYFIPLRKL